MISQSEAIHKSFCKFLDNEKGVQTDNRFDTSLTPINKKKERTLKDQEMRESAWFNK